jgi:WD40 repeat protein/uncharacterized caspase-like protein
MVPEVIAVQSPVLTDRYRLLVKLGQRGKGSEMFLTRATLFVFLVGLSLPITSCTGRSSVGQSSRAAVNPSPASSQSAVSATGTRQVSTESAVSATGPRQVSSQSNAGTAGGRNEVGPAIELVPQFGHGLNVQGISISPNGKVAATASADKTVGVWDAETGILLRKLAVRSQVHDVAILGDGVRAVVAASNSVEIWDLVHGQRTAEFKTDRSPAIRVRLMHRGNFVVLGDAGGGVELWDLGRLERVRHLVAEHPGDSIVWDVDVTSDDRTVAVASKNGTIQLVEVESGRILRDLTGHRRDVRAARFTKNGKTLVSFGSDATIRLWDVNSGRELQSYPFGAAIDTGALVTDDTAIVGGYSDSVRIIDLKTGRSLRNIEPWPGVPFSGASSIAVTSDGRRSVVADFRATVLFSNLADGTPIHATRSQRQGPFALALSPQGDKLAWGFAGGEVEVWDAVLGERVRRIASRDFDNAWTALAFSPDGRLLVRGSHDTITVWDARSGEVVREIKSPTITISTLAISPNGRLVAVAGWGKIAAFELGTGRPLWAGAKNVMVERVAFTPDNAQLVTGSSNKHAAIYEAATGAEVLQFEGPSSSLASIDFLDRQTALLGASDVVGLWDLRLGKLVGRYAKSWRDAGVGVFSIGHKWVLTGDEIGVMHIFDAHGGKQLRQFPAHLDNIRAIVPSRDGKLVFSTSFDGTIRVTPTETLAQDEPSKDRRAMVWLSDRDEWLTYSADGYFDASRRGGSLVAAVSGLDGFRVDQLAVRNNRPDLALGRIGLGTSESLALFASRHQQRLRQLGYDETELSTNLISAPRALITDFSSSGRRGRLHCRFSGNGRKLKRYFVFVNDVAVGSGEGTPLSGTDATVDVDVELSSGRNKLETSVLNDLGVESFRDVRTANVVEQVRGNLYYLGFGVSNYADPRLALRYAHKDALNLGQTLQQMEGRGFDRVYARILTNAEVTKASILAARAFLSQARVDDTAVVFVAGHGVFGNGPHEQYYFVTHDTDISRIHETAAGFNLIEDLVTGIPPRKKLLLLDTCESGERDGDEETVRVTAGHSRGLTARGIRPVVLASPTKTATRSRFVGHRDRFIFNDLSRRSGTIVFSASHGNELSYEDDRLQNGIFTYELVRALTGSAADVDRNGSVTTDELRSHVGNAVTTRTQGLQNPTVDRDNLEALFGFPVR